MKQGSKCQQLMKNPMESYLS